MLSTTSDRAATIKSHHQCLSRKLRLRYVRQKGSRVDIDGVTADRLDDRDSQVRHPVAKGSDL